MILFSFLRSNCFCYVVLLLQLFPSCLSLFSEKLKSRYCEEGLNEKSDAKSRKDQISQKPLLLETQYCLLKLHFLLSFNIELLISANTQRPLVHGKNALELSFNVQTTKILSKEHIRLLKHCKKQPLGFYLNCIEA